MNIRELMARGPVIAVIVIEEHKHAVPLARALVAGGVRVLEVTLRTPIALEAVQAIAQQVEEAIVGVGTVTQPRQIEAAQKAGARFVVSPGFTLELSRAATWSELPLLPGVMSPSDVISALSAGHHELKFFPAEAAGGVEMLKALAGPFQDVTFCPTGGISAAKAPGYLALSNVSCVGGSWLTPKALVQAEDWPAIERLAREAARLKRSRS